MDKLKMQSLDVIGSNIQKIAQLFPNCVTEHFGKDGKTELGIDFEKLQAELSNDIISEAINALIVLGYSSLDARRTVMSVANEASNLEDIIRLSLKKLSSI